jgi:hypothetical protein
LSAKKLGVKNAEPEKLMAEMHNKAKDGAL